MEFIGGFLVIIFAAWFVGIFDGDGLLPWKDESGEGNDWQIIIVLLLLILSALFFLI